MTMMIVAPTDVSIRESLDYQAEPTNRASSNEQVFRGLGDATFSSMMLSRWGWWWGGEFKDYGLAGIGVRECSTCCLRLR
jgi:surfactin synthase thioesterase subunit